VNINEQQRTSANIKTFKNRKGLLPPFLGALRFFAYQSDLETPRHRGENALPANNFSDTASGLQ